MSNPLEMNGSPPQTFNVPPAEWMMVGFQCAVQEVDIGGQKMKALIFRRDGVLLVFPVDSVGARNIGNQLLDKPAIFTPDLQIPNL